MSKIAFGSWAVSNNYLPLWNQYMPRGASRLSPPPPPAADVADAKKRVVYLPSCVTRMMGPSRGDVCCAAARTLAAQWLEPATTSNSSMLSRLSCDRAPL